MRMILPVLLLLLASVSASAVVQIQPRVIGGTIVADDAWPAVVAVRMEVRDGSDRLLERRCVGTLIAPRWVMTAAHCFFSQQSVSLQPDATAENTRVYLDRALISSEVLPPQAGHAASNVFIHPGFSPLFRRYDSDIALIELAFPLEDATLQTLGATPRAGDLATIVGWGVTEVGLDGKPKAGARLADELHEADLPIVDVATCRQVMGSGNVTDNMLCAGYPDGGVDSCVGDSGGPLLVKQGGRYRQVGIVSFGDGCARPDRYGVYTRVSAFSDWIAELTGTSAPAASETGQGDGSDVVAADVPVQPRSGGGAMSWLLAPAAGLLRRRWRPVT